MSLEPSASYMNIEPKNSAHQQQTQQQQPSK